MPSFEKGALIAELDETWSSLVAACRDLDDEQWDRVTACPGWSVKDHLSHIIGTESMLLGRQSPAAAAERPGHVRNDIGAFNEVWVEERRSRPGAEVLDELREVTAERLAALGAMSQEEFDAESWTPAGQATYGRFMQIRVFDCWVHEQDVREALDRPGHGTGPAVERSLAEVSGAMGYVIGKKAGAPDGSSVRLELSGPRARTLDVAVTGGKARLAEQPVAQPTATVGLDGLLFLRLASGRCSADGPLADGRVQLTGDRDLAERVVRNLAFVI